MKALIVFILFLLSLTSSVRAQPPFPPGPGFGAPRGQDLPHNDETYLAWSEDGFNWEVEKEPVFRQASVPDILVRANGEFLLYWVDFSEFRGPDSEQISVARSTDGKNWTEPVRITIQGISGVKAVDPSVVELKDGRLRMYYLAPMLERPTNPIMSAVSRDGGKTFVEEKGVRFQGRNVTDPDVIRKRDGTWVMYLSHGEETLITISRDGLRFSESDVIVEEGGVPGAAVLADGRVRLFVTSRDGIKSLISGDGIFFQREPGIRIYPLPDAPITADPSVTRAPDGRWVMAFKRRPFSTGRPLPPLVDLSGIK